MSVDEHSPPRGELKIKGQAEVERRRGKMDDEDKVFSSLFS